MERGRDGDKKQDRDRSREREMEKEKRDREKKRPTKRERDIGSINRVVNKVLVYSISVTLPARPELFGRISDH